MVWDIVQRKALEARANVLSNEVGDLELTYLALSSKVDVNLSQVMGFYEVKPTFATRPTLSVVKLANNEI